VALEHTQAAIDNLLTDHHQISLSKIAVSSMERLRRRITRNLQRVAIRLWNMRNWTFTYVDLTDGSLVLTVANNSEVDLPAEWANEGKDGGVWLFDEPKTPLRWRRSGEIAHYRNGHRAEGTPELYTVVGLRKLQGWPFATGDTKLSLRYQATAPIIADSDDPDTNGLSRFPADWRDTVLYEWLVWYEMKDKGDVAGMASQWELVRDAILDMCCKEHQGKPWEEHLPRFEGSADVMAEMYL
jgi:hypothetical protein